MFAQSSTVPRNDFSGPVSVNSNTPQHARSALLNSSGHKVPRPQSLVLSFAPAVTYGSGGTSSSVALADVNGDGKLDIVVTNQASQGNVGVLLGNGDGTFQAVVTYSSGGFIRILSR
jgi:hypothetical protein